MAEKMDSGDPGGASANLQAEAMSEDDRSPDGGEDSVTLSFLDKLKCMMYSKVERDAFLIEKLEKEEKKKAKKMAPGETETKKKKTLFDKMKSLFSTPEEQHEFLRRQVKELEERQRSQKTDTRGAHVADDGTVANSP